MRRGILLSLLFVSYLSVISQTGNYTMINQGHGVYFDKNYNLKFIEGLASTGYNGFTQSNYNGSLSYYSGDFIYNKTGNPIRLESKLRSINSANVILNDSVHLIFENVFLKNVNSKPIFNILKTILTQKDGLWRIDTSFYRIPFINTNTYGLTAIADTNDNTWLIVRTGAMTVSSYKYSKSVNYDTVINSQIPALMSPYFEMNAYISYLSFKPSPSGNYVSVISIENITLPNDVLIERTARLDLLSFNKESGHFAFINNVFIMRDSNLFSNLNIRRFYWKTDYSPNDLYLYYSYQIDKIGIGPIETSDSTYVYRYTIPDFQSKVLYSLNNRKDLGGANAEEGVSDLKIMADGNILCLRRGSRNGLFGFLLDEIKNPNNENSQVNNGKYHFATVVVPSRFHFYCSKYNYIRIRPKYVYDCNGTVTFEDNSDYGLPNTKVTYFVEDTAGTRNLKAVGQNPTLVYNRTGDYLVKVVLKSDEGNYKEIHYDTMKIRIPEKPAAAFKAVDTIICRYLPLQFRNYSFAKEINPNKKPEYLWHFGDGQTSSDYEPTHVYTQPGTYTVSLFYSNGYCDSTLVKNQYIRVVDAPKPGFSIDNNRGCSPFTVNFTDTTVLNVTKKEYYFSDIDQWQIVSSLKFSHTFTQPGIFRAVQRLYGYTGCIIQTDSVFIYVTPGLTANDTVHIVNSSYLDNNLIEVQWQALSAAVKYAVYKDGVLLTETDQTVYADIIPEPALMEYSAKGIDSCGTQSSSGRIGKPVLLSGAVQGNNELSVLNFTPYQQWDDPEIEYTIEHFLPTAQLPLGILNPTDSFADKAFLQEGWLEKCYRVSARGLNNALVSYSNILCLPYKPVIYVPSSFTPNNDELNDVFKPQVFGIEHYEFEIYNRWGEIIFSSEANGHWNALDVNPGIYMYRIILRSSEGISYFRNGTVHLVK